MPFGKSPEEWDPIIWAIAAVSGLMGGLIRVWGRLRAGQPRVFNFLELLGELVVSGLVGLLAYLGAAGLDLSGGICSAVAGIAGHMGTRWLVLLERVLEARIDKK